MKPGDKLTRRRPGLDRKGSNPWQQVEGRPCPRQHPCPPSCPSPSRPSARTDYPARAPCMISVNLFSTSLHRARTHAYKFSRKHASTYVPPLRFATSAFEGNVRVRSTRSTIALMQRPAVPIREKYCQRVAGARERIVIINRYIYIIQIYFIGEYIVTVPRYHKGKIIAIFSLNPLSSSL